MLVAAARTDLVRKLVLLEGNEGGGTPDEHAAIGDYFRSWKVPFPGSAGGARCARRQSVDAGLGGRHGEGCRRSAPTFRRGRDAVRHRGGRPTTVGPNGNASRRRRWRFTPTVACSPRSRRPVSSTGDTTSHALTSSERRTMHTWMPSTPGSKHLPRFFGHPEPAQTGNRGQSSKPGTQGEYQTARTPPATLRKRSSTAHGAAAPPRPPPPSSYSTSNTTSHSMYLHTYPERLTYPERAH